MRAGGLAWFWAFAVVGGLSSGWGIPDGRFPGSRPLVGRNARGMARLGSLLGVMLVHYRVFNLFPAGIAGVLFILASILSFWLPDTLNKDLPNRFRDPQNDTDNIQMNVMQPA